MTRDGTFQRGEGLGPAILLIGKPDALGMTNFVPPMRSEPGIEKWSVQFVSPDRAQAPHRPHPYPIDPCASSE